MTPEELMQPRYKVVATYPSIEEDNWAVGDVIDVYRMKFAFPDEMNTYLETYPHLFRKLGWWEDRSDLPDYVKSDAGVYEVSHYRGENIVMIKVNNSFSQPLSLEYLLPSTKEEFNARIKA